MKTILWWICAIIAATVVFCVGIILIPMQTKIAEKTELTYIFVDENWNKYDIFEPVHGSATDWSFLFQEENQDDVFSWTKNDDPISGTILKKDYLSEIIETWKNTVFSGEKDSASELISELDALKKDISENTTKTDDLIKFNDCITPQNATIKHGESIIAYEQRKDIPTICNAQRRVCNDGVLNWTFVQASCEEDVEYKYTRVRAISYNKKEVSDLIQNPWYAKNDDGNFDTDGKINPDEKIAKTIWDNTITGWTKTDIGIEQTQKTYFSCTSPWWDVVQHGQFIKAYQSPLWFVDQKCSVELRLCLNGSFNWTYNHKKCEHKDLTYQDFISWNNDINKPSNLLLDEINQKNKQKKWIFWRIFGLFN